MIWIMPIHSSLGECGTPMELTASLSHDGALYEKVTATFIAYDDRGRAFSFLRCVVCA